MTRRHLAILAVFLLGFGAFGNASADASLELVKVVLLSRHGVRPPTKSNAKLAEFSPKEWPTWPVAPGELTPHGARMIETLGGYFRALYAQQHLLRGAGCPQAGAVRVWADNADQRTRASGDALLSGLLPNCGQRAAYRLPIEDDDPMFHSAPVCPLDPDAARRSVLERAGGSIDSVAAAQRQRLALLQEILAYRPRDACPRAQACTLDTLPNELKADAAGRDIRLDGPLAIASSVVETLLLEYAEGLPADQVGWGQAATPERLAQLLPLHNLKGDLLGRAPYVAARRGSLLADRILAELRQGARGNDGGKVVALMGHDTNLANVAGLLGLEWHVAEQPDNTAPGATLAFELLRNKHSGKYFVRTRLYVQTLEQLRHGLPLDLKHPPATVALAPPGCGKAAKLCPFERFAAAVDRVVDKECVSNAQSAASGDPRYAIVDRYKIGGDGKWEQGS